jgi:hypothetical protein
LSKDWIAPVSAPNMSGNSITGLSGSPNDLLKSSA